MSFLIVFLLGLVLFFLFERKKFLKLDALELTVVCVGIGVALLTIFALYIILWYNIAV